MPRNNLYLFGYPISHSVTPPFHSFIFNALGVDNKYQLCEIKSVDNPKLVSLIRSSNFAGASVTMPLKVAIIPYLDRITDDAKQIGSINTIFLERHPDPIKAAAGEVHLVGTNTDYLGIKNSLSTALKLRRDEESIKDVKAAFIIGGGGTTRAAVYALTKLSYSPIYLINRDIDETKSILEQFPNFDLRPLESPTEWTDEHARSLCVGVGAIPDIPPVTNSEKNVFAIAEQIFSSCANVHGSNQCTMLEMAYKPRKTTMLKKAQNFGWTVVGGIEAMIEQGFSQDRLWLREEGQTDLYQIKEEIEEKARELIRAMDDIVVTKN